MSALEVDIGPVAVAVAAVVVVGAVPVVVVTAVVVVAVVVVVKSESGRLLWVFREVAFQLK